jgi:methylated-DNA-[protein]-cysteine S-methyltransferase
MDPAMRSREWTAVAFDSELGWSVIAHRGDMLCGLVFGYTSHDKAARALRRRLGDAQNLLVDAVGEVQSLPASQHDLVVRLRQYATGEPVEFNDIQLDDAFLTPFGRRVVAACRRIPRGQTRTYGQLAAVAGSPGAARAVGRVMASNRFPLVVPCHRVVGANGSLGGFSAPKGLAMKRRLLELEKRVLFASAN